MNQVKSLAKIIVYILLVLSVYWGTLLAFFTIREFILTAHLSPNFFLLAVAALGLITWVNAWYYYNRIQKNSLASIWNNFYTKNKARVWLTLVLLVLFILLFILRTYLATDIIPEFIFNVIAVPWALGQQILFIITTNTRRFLPFLDFLNQGLGILIPLVFQLIASYYLSKLIFWPAKKKSR